MLIKKITNINYIFVSFVFTIFTFILLKNDVVQFLTEGIYIDYSRNIKESKSNNVFISEFKCKNPVIIINDTIGFRVKDIWQEFRWSKMYKNSNKLFIFKKTNFTNLLLNYEFLNPQNSNLYLSEIWHFDNNEHCLRNFGEKIENEESVTQSLKKEKLFFKQLILDIEDCYEMKDTIKWQIYIGERTLFEHIPKERKLIGEFEIYRVK